VEKCVNHFRLQLRRDAPDHSEIEKRESSVRHHQKISRMRVGVKKSVFEKLFQISANQQTIDFFRRNVAGAQFIEP
jgi:hypothetical protein